jgi:hypothetical protein
VVHLCPNVDGRPVDGCSDIAFASLPLKQLIFNVSHRPVKVGIERRGIPCSWDFGSSATRAYCVRSPLDVPRRRTPLRYLQRMKAPLICVSSIAIVACLAVFYDRCIQPVNTLEVQSRERTGEAEVDASSLGGQQPPEENRKLAAGLARPEDSPAPDLERRIAQALRSGKPDDSLKLLAALTYVDPVAAARLAQLPGPLREDAMRVVAQNWAALDRVGAERWAAQLQNPDERDTALNYLCHQVSQSDPVQAIEIAAHHGIGGQKGLIQNLAEQWATKEFFSAEAWASTLSAGEERDQIYMRLALVLSKTAPQDAAQLLLDQIAPGAMQNEAAISVLHQWAIGDYDGAAAWVARFPAGELRERAVQELAGFAASKTHDSP